MSAVFIAKKCAEATVVALFAAAQIGFFTWLNNGDYIAGLLLFIIADRLTERLFA